jgi:hypothetical protein
MELAGVFQRNRRLFRAANVILTLGDGQLRIDFNGGGCVLLCECPQSLVAELTASGFSGIALEHRHEKSAAKTTCSANASQVSPELPLPAVCHRANPNRQHVADYQHQSIP